MPSWTPKEQREYEHIRDSARARGTSAPEAAEIAGRTVNKHRRERGETPNRTTQGTGNPNRPLADRTRDELRNLARAADIPGRSRMSKAALVDALQQRR